MIEKERESIVMTGFDNLKHRLARISDDTAQLIDEAAAIVQRSDECLSGWRSTCRNITQQINEETMRVAVVGAIKSGKSTFVNTLFGGDYLKRGAGVVTSIVTRVKTGARLRASLFLKSWGTLNREVNQAAILLPAHHRADDSPIYDLRQEKDRQILGRALGELAADQLITNDTRSSGSVLLDSCLKGFDRMQSHIGERRATLVFDAERFPLHRDYVGDDAMAVYLEDVLLEIDRPGIGEGVEIADCQGSDSPNPLHLAMIQDYLTLAHLTIYVISSRTGLRQADLRFLTMIRSMGILENVVFVVNCDLSEHESLTDLRQGLARITTELSLICPEPRLFAFSSLFRLLSQMADALSAKDQARLSHWQRETDLVDFSASEVDRLQRLLDHKIARERRALLLKNHLERLEIVATGIGNWIGVNRDLLARDAGGAKALADRLDHQHGRLDRLKLTVKSTLDGAVNQIKVDLKRAVDQFYDSHGDGVVAGVVHFVRGYQVELPRYADNLSTSGFARTLYRVFQDFKQALDSHMAETVNPQVIRFVREQEKAFLTYLDEIAGPFGAMIDEALDQYAGAMQEVRMVRRQAAAPIHVGDSLESIRKMAGLSLPTAAATMHYSAQIKTEAVVRLGIYKIVNLIRSAFKRPSAKVRQEPLMALAASIKRMKRETERSVRFHLKDHKENIKYQYLLKLTDAVAMTLQRRMVERFQHHGADLSQLVQLISEKRLDKETVTASLDRMATFSRNLETQIAQLKEELRQLDD